MYIVRNDHKHNTNMKVVNGLPWQHGKLLGIFLSGYRLPPKPDETATMQWQAISNIPNTPISEVVQQPLLEVPCWIVSSISFHYANPVRACSFTRSCTMVSLGSARTSIKSINGGISYKIFSTAVTFTFESNIKLTFKSHNICYIAVG